MEKEGIMDGKFIFKTLPDSTLDKTKVICSICRAEFSYHRSTSSLRYHLQAKHTDPSVSSASGNVRQTTLDSRFRSRSMDTSTSSKLTQAIAKWIATACRPVYIVEDEGLRDIIRIASGDLTYELPSRATVMSRIHEWYDTEKAKLATNLDNTASVALTGDYWTSLGNHSYLGVTAHYIDQEWKLHSHALTVMRTDERHMADVCASHFMDVAGQWNIEEKVSTLNTDSARNMIAASKQLPFEHLPCTAHSIQRSVTVALQNSAFDGALAKCRKVVGHFKHSPPNTAELKTQQVAHGLKAEALVQDVPTRWNSTLEMIKRVQRNQEALRDVLAQKQTNVTMPTKSEMEKLQKLEILLEPCRYYFLIKFHFRPRYVIIPHLHKPD